MCVPGRPIVIPTRARSRARTPFAGLAFAVLAAFLYALLFGKTRRSRLIASTTLFCSAITLAFAGYALKEDHRVSQLVAAAAGMFGYSYSVNSTVSDRERGDAAGTAETRVVFWRPVVMDPGESITTLMLGNGHRESFVEKTKPYDDFVDTDVLQPHNSFIGLFYRYGFLGLGLFIAFLMRSRTVRVWLARSYYIGTSAISRAPKILRFNMRRSCT
jgi:hypothetical protein